MRVPERVRIRWTPRTLSRALPLFALAILPTGCQPPSPSTEVVVLTEGWEFSRSAKAPGPDMPEKLIPTIFAPYGIFLLELKNYRNQLLTTGLDNLELES